VSEQQAEQTSAEPGSSSFEPAVPSSSLTQSAPLAVAAPESVTETPDVASPGLVPEQAAATVLDAPKADAPKADAPKVDEPRVDSPEADAPKAEAPRSPGKVMIMSSGDRDWGNDHDAGLDAEPEQGQGMFGEGRLAALAAVVTLAVLAGALGGAVATAGLTHFVADDATGAGNHTLEASIARIDADLLNLKVSVEHSSKMGMSQFNKTSDRLDKVEKAQAEPLAKLAKLSDAVDKLRAAPPAAAQVPVAAAPVAAKEVTGSITPPAAAPAVPPKAEVARLPTVEGWVLRDVANGVALIEGRQGMYEVYAGDPVPGLGRVDAIRRQDGRWVVVTSKGLIVAR
jgi:hypothetical protein